LLVKFYLKDIPQSLAGWVDRIPWKILQVTLIYHSSPVLFIISEQANSRDSTIQTNWTRTYP